MHVCMCAHTHTQIHNTYRDMDKIRWVGKIVGTLTLKTEKSTMVTEITDKSNNKYRFTEN